MSFLRPGNTPGLVCSIRDPWCAPARNRMDRRHRGRLGHRGAIRTVGPGLSEGRQVRRPVSMSAERVIELCHHFVIPRPAERLGPPRWDAFTSWADGMDAADAHRTGARPGSSSRRATRRRPSTRGRRSASRRPSRTGSRTPTWGHSRSSGTVSRYTCRWYVDIDWQNGERTGTLTVNAAGKPFHTAPPTTVYYYGVWRP